MDTEELVVNQPRDSTVTDLRLAGNQGVGQGRPGGSWSPHLRSWYFSKRAAWLWA